MARSRATNLLALAVLSLLQERPMHPYELAATMRYRELSSVVKLTTGTLYSVIASLERDGFIAPVETQRRGQYPERTVYATTDRGHAALLDWLRSLLRTPVVEYPAFAAALAFLGHLPPLEVAVLLEDHAQHLQEQVDGATATLERGRQLGVDRLFLVEDAYALALLQTKLSFVRGLITEIHDGTLTQMADGVLTWAIQHPELAQAMDEPDTSSGTPDHEARFAAPDDPTGDGDNQ
jgi:DNA-binding PadR family transcriptional regulator